MQVPILKQGAYLIAIVQSALTDDDLRSCATTLVVAVEQGPRRAASSSTSPRSTCMTRSPTRTLRDIAHMIRLRGAETVIVGIQPDVAFAMVQLGLTLEGVTPRWTSRRASRT